jgi:hypothetical protein
MHGTMNLNKLPITLLYFEEVLIETVLTLSTLKVCCSYVINGKMPFNLYLLALLFEILLAVFLQEYNECHLYAGKLNVNI